MFTLRRRAARVVLLDPDDRVLLLQASDPAVRSRPPWWELPGGGVEPSEPSEVATTRELFEETGIEGCEMGPCLWTHHAEFDFAGFHFDQHERIHVARVAVRGAPYRPAGLEAVEAVAFQGARWWSLDELIALAEGGTRLIPPWLPAQLAAAFESGWCSEAPPAEPLDMGEEADWG